MQYNLTIKQVVLVTFAKNLKWGTADIFFIRGVWRVCLLDSAVEILYLKILTTEVIFYVFFVKGEDVLDTTKIPPRWLKLTKSRFLNKENSEPSQTTSRQVNVQTKRAQTTSTGLSAQDQPHRFRKAKTLTDELADLTALTGGRQYIIRMKLFEDILRFWKSKRECAVLPVSVEGVVDGEYTFIL